MIVWCYSKLEYLYCWVRVSTNEKHANGYQLGPSSCSIVLLFRPYPKLSTIFKVDVQQSWINHNIMLIRPFYKVFDVWLSFFITMILNKLLYIYKMSMYYNGLNNRVSFKLSVCKMGGVPTYWKAHNYHTSIQRFVFICPLIYTFKSN